MITENKHQIKVWDGFVRFFHWALVGSIALLYFSGEEGWMSVHFVAGFSVLTLVLTRLIWGVIGSDTAKLSRLFHGPKAVWQSITTPSESIGHNPAGSYMVLLFLALILAQATSGLMTTDDILTEGPLVAVVDSSWVELASRLHRLIFDGLLIAIALHISAIVIYRLRGKHLVKAMVSGTMQASTQTVPQIKSGWIAFIIWLVLQVAIFSTWGLESFKSLFN
ncbi:cytochrome b/b6 domain-containing protein [Pseudoalteromonas tunicata]|uniref:cytochrome b/b6 domain-containing protein n=1 Tax=Pseudoalteromonas tunicata TaxID=314281 RepID=UPI00274000C8|nr:cytochrome b/b6 domain-containing protein [Pseudoalteromonas tunicata]MDP4983140.1 cytochrome b/b6 domain-containing protein [Pseudoalteromonas tunicata]MDP5214606.1 cytochrome b/b6 domain-containing protein [Pseudoalteromonas tunicata]